MQKNLSMVMILGPRGDPLLAMLHSEADRASSCISAQVDHAALIISGPHLEWPAFLDGAVHFS